MSHAETTCADTLLESWSTEGFAHLPNARTLRFPTCDLVQTEHFFGKALTLLSESHRALVSLRVSHTHADVWILHQTCLLVEI